MRIEISEDDATSVRVDVLALKYAQARYGLDSYVYERLLEAGHTRETRNEPRTLPGIVR
jgi:hypothetical protein